MDFINKLFQRKTELDIEVETIGIVTFVYQESFAKTSWFVKCPENNELLGPIMYTKESDISILIQTLDTFNFDEILNNCKK